MGSTEWLRKRGPTATVEHAHSAARLSLARKRAQAKADRAQIRIQPMSLA